MGGGGEYEPDRAGNHETGLGTTTAVGCFPAGQSRTGCEEMVGTVWEWTRSLRGGYPYPEAPEDRAEREDPGAGGPRVLRGGGFASGAVDARCAARNVSHPRSRGIGFRLLLSPSSSDL